MAIQNLFIRPERSIAGIKIDGVLYESHSNTADVTKNPVESGADITDHVIVQPSVLVIRGVITDTPFVGILSPELIETTQRLFGFSTPSGDTRSQQGYAALVDIQQRREPIVIQTKLVTYNNMIITSLRVNQDKDTSRIVDFTLEATEIIIVNTEIVAIPYEQLEPGKVAQQASSTVESGRVEAVPVEANTSIAKKIANFFTGD